MKSDYELIQEYEDISKTNKPKIAPYYGDMFIDVEMEYLMRKELQQRIDKAIEYIEEEWIFYEDAKTGTGEALVNRDKVLEILKGEDNNE